MGKPEMSKSDQVRLIGAKLCRFTNGTPCLCAERGTLLCQNVKMVALDCWEIAHQAEMTRQEFNDQNRLDANLGGERKVAAVKAPAKKKR